MRSCLRQAARGRCHEARRDATLMRLFEAPLARHFTGFIDSFDEAITNSVSRHYFGFIEDFIARSRQTPD